MGALRPQYAIHIRHARANLLSEWQPQPVILDRRTAPIPRHAAIDPPHRTDPPPGLLMAQVVKDLALERRFQRVGGGEAEGHCPVLPNPPAPRPVAGSSSISVIVGFMAG